MQKIFYPFVLSFMIAGFLSCKKSNEAAIVIPAPTPFNAAVFYAHEGTIGANDNSSLISIDNNVVICGMSHSNNALIIKSSKTGTQIWRKEFDVGLQGNILGITEANTQDLFICGHVNRTANTQFLLVKANSNGDTLWTKTYGGADADYAHQIIKTADGNILMCGITYGYPTDAFPDIYLVKVNYNGDTLWTRTFHDQDQEVPFSLMQTQNGEFLITGANSDGGYNELYLLKVSNNGTKLWDQKIGPADWKWGYSSTELPNGDIMTCGIHTLPAGYNQILLVKTNAVGNMYWEKEFGDPQKNEEANSIKQNADGTLTIIGQAEDLNVQKADVMLLKVDQNGNQILFNRFGGTDGEWGANLLKDSNDDNIITGTTYTYGSNAFMGNIFITTTDNNGIYK